MRGLRRTASAGAGSCSDPPRGATGTGKSTVTTEVAPVSALHGAPPRTSCGKRCGRSSRSTSCPRSTTRASKRRGGRYPDEAKNRRSSASTIRRGTCSSGSDAVIDRALTERYSMALEGVQVVPGLVPATVEGAVVVQALLAIEDEDEHARTSGSATPAQGPAAGGEVLDSLATSDASRRTSSSGPRRWRPCDREHPRGANCRSRDQLVLEQVERAVELQPRREPR